MSILDPQKIDIVATRPDSAIVKLVIADHLDWGDLDAHAKLIQAKVNTYLEFVESGQLMRVKTPEIPKSPDICIVLALEHAPTQEALAFIGKVAAFLKDAGLKFETEMRGQE